MYCNTDFKCNKCLCNFSVWIYPHSVVKCCPLCYTYDIKNIDDLNPNGGKINI